MFTWETSACGVPDDEPAKGALSNDFGEDCEILDQRVSIESRGECVSENESSKE